MTSGRTVRTYGRRQLVAASSPPPGMVHAPSSSGTLLFTPPSSPSSSKGKGRAQAKFLSLASGNATDGDDDGHCDRDHTPSSPTHARKRRHRDVSPPPLVAPLLTHDSNRPEAPAKQGTLKGFFVPVKRSRVTSDAASTTTPKPTSTSTRIESQSTKAQTPKRAATHTPAPSRPAPLLHQLQFMANAVHSCTECSMSYMRGTDDADHKRHHARVTRGIPWNGRKEARVVEDGIPLAWSVKAERDTSSPANGESSNKTPTRHRPNSILPLVSLATRHAVREYRILVIDASTSGRLISEILRTVDTVLAAPELPREILARCKLFLATTACEPPAIPGAKRRPGPKPKENGAERIVGVVVSQSIKWAMRVLREGEKYDKAVDSGDGVFCDPTPRPTPLGIHRLFTVPAYRGCGIAGRLLNAAASETVYGCSFDPTKGEVAFSQPTESGKRTMEKWGGGAIRVFVDDESQL